jgi:NADPH:quinone reductase-like Zn-dependent oxidoreductase
MSLSNRAIVYSEIGSPASVLFAISYPKLPPPPPGTANVKFILAPINPADINVIEGVYPSRPAPKISFFPSGKGTLEHPVFVAGNEGLAEVTEVGSGVTGLHKGDRVIITKQQAGTWTSSENLRASDVLRIPRIKGRPDLSDVHGATMTVCEEFSAVALPLTVSLGVKVNPPTAYNMLQDFVSLEEGDWVLQNGANSAVSNLLSFTAATRVDCVDRLGKLLYR